LRLIHDDMFDFWHVRLEFTLLIIHLAHLLLLQHMGRKAYMLPVGVEIVAPKDRHFHA
jgi:hypothetical protein